MDWCRARFAATCCRWRHCQPELTARFLRQIPHAKVVDVSRAAHMVAGDQNDAFSDAVITFLDRDIRPRLGGPR
mgnify:CR=1 FL=1